MGDKNMEQNELAKIFSDRISEICFEKNIEISYLIEKFSKNLDKKWLSNCFDGKELPNDILLIGLAKYLQKNINDFFEPGEKVLSKELLNERKQKYRIMKLEEILNKKIIFAKDNYEQVLNQNVEEALNKELISGSYAAYLLDKKLEEVIKY